MESIIIFSGSSLICFFIMALFTKGMKVSFPQSRVLRSLARNQEAPAADDIEKTHKKEQPRSLIHRFIHRLAKEKKSLSQKDIELASAGLKDWTSAEWRVLNNTVAFAVAFGAGIIVFTLSFSIIMQIQLTLIGFIVGYILPNTWLRSKINQRKEEIVRTLPEILDLIMVSVEAGLGFDAAMMKVVEKQIGVLPDEFNIVLQEIKMGKPRRDALRDMAKKNNVDDLRNVIASLVQADQLGVSIGSVLRNQSIQIRQKRKQRAQEQAQKAPVKIMIPLVFFIFPSIFIVILGPAFIKIIETFSK